MLALMSSGGPVGKRGKSAHSQSVSNSRTNAHVVVSKVIVPSDKWGLGGWGEILFIRKLETNMETNNFFGVLEL